MAEPGDSGGQRRSPDYWRLERIGRASWWILGVSLLVILGFFLLQRYGAFVIPSLGGIVVATTLSPVVGWLARHRVPRILGALIVTLAVVAALVALVWWSVVIVVDQSAQIWSTLQAGATQIEEWLGQGKNANETVVRVREIVANLRSGAVSGLVPLALKGVRQFYDLLVALFLAGGFSFFFLWEGPDVRRFVARHIDQPEELGLRITASLVRTTRRYVAGLSLIGASEAVLVGATGAVLGVGAWPVIALSIFLGNYIPYIGGLVAAIFAVLFTLGSQGVGPAIVMLVVVAVAYFLGSHLGAFAIGGALRLPVTSVFVLTMAGAAVLGVFGAAAAAPVARLLIDAREIVRQHRAEEEEGEAGAGGGPAPAG